MNSNQISNFSLKKYKADLIIMSKPKFTKFKLLKIQEQIHRYQIYHQKRIKQRKN